MPVLRSLRGVLAGAAFINAVPHGYAAVTGAPFPSPFGDPPGRGNSAPPVNAAWSLANLALGRGLVRGPRGSRPPLAAVLAGGFVMAVALSWFFGPEGPSRPSRRR